MRAVSPISKAAAGGSKPAPRRRLPRTLKAAVKLDEKDLLIALRGKLAAEIDSGVPAHTLAGLVKQLRDLDREIRLLETRAELEREEQAKVEARGDRAWSAAAI